MTGEPRETPTLGARCALPLLHDGPCDAVESGNDARPSENQPPVADFQARLARAVAALKTLRDGRKWAHMTYNGGWHENPAHEAFHHGMDTVFNIIEAEARAVLKDEAR